MRAVDLIHKKRDGHPLSDAEIDAFVDGTRDDGWPDYQLSAMLMAIFWRGMTREETARLTWAMAHSGVVLDWSDVEGPKVDKHSSGGVGDKTSMVVVPLATACGVIVPKMSGRGLGHTGGTVDKLESIPGFRTDLSLEEFKAALRSVGAAMIGQTQNIAPADKKLYALRDVTATVDHIPLITASILSKKLAENLDGLVLDVKCGQGAFMKTEPDARALAEELLAVARLNRLPTQVVISNMEAPLGNAIGHALEVAECIETLRGDGPADLTELAVELASRMVLLAGIAESQEQASQRVREALDSGKALEKFRAIIAQQGGDHSIVDDSAKLPISGERELIPAKRSGVVTAMNAEMLGQAAMGLGGGRERKEDVIDHTVGVMLLVKPGDEVRAGDGLAELYTRNDRGIGEAREWVRTAIELGDEARGESELILARLD